MATWTRGDGRGEEGTACWSLLSWYLATSLWALETGESTIWESETQYGRCQGQFKLWRGYFGLDLVMIVEVFNIPH